MVIPEAAVEAAAKALALCDGYTESSWASRASDPEYGHGYYANVARAALEAAAPHMLIHVHHHDIEDHARSYNEGYEAATQQMAGQ